MGALRVLFFGYGFMEPVWYLKLIRPPYVFGDRKPKSPEGGVKLEKVFARDGEMRMVCEL
ncbi:hypothetical protein L903_16530 [Agrobacterium sp. JL28]|nr:hypothetical protein L903_16530 [Agrobacterium sp. JL28]